MKKIYLFFLGLFTLLSVNVSAQTRIVASDTSEWITDLSTIQEGDYILFYANAESGRTGFLNNRYDDTEAVKPVIKDFFSIGGLDSRSYGWKLFNVSYNYDGDVVASLDTKIESPSGKYLDIFYDGTDDGGSKWMSNNILVDGEENAGVWTIRPITTDDGFDSVEPTWFYITDGSGMFNVEQGGGTDALGEKYNNFCGWSGGTNSRYMIKTVHFKEVNVVTIDVECMDQNGDGIDGGVYTTEVTPGDTIAIPSFEHYSFNHAEDIDGNVLETPIYADWENTYYTLYYDKWPAVSVMCYDEDGKLLYAADNYYEIGTTFTPPTDRSVTLGYELITTDYDGHVWTADDDQTEISLTYRKNPTCGLPFVPTTVENGQFAEGTKYYKMKVRGYAAFQKYPNDPSHSATLYYGDTYGTTIDSDSLDYALWAYEGDLDKGFQIYNVGMGGSYKLYATSATSGTYIYLGSDDYRASLGEDVLTTFDLISNNSGGYTLKIRDAQGNATKACINHYSWGSDLRFWEGDNALNDAGSNITFEEVTPEELETYQWLSTTNYLRAEGMVGGWTSEQMADLKAAYAAKDRTAKDAALAALAEAETIEFNPSMTYQIISAYQDFQIQQPGVTYAIYATADDTVRWGALNSEDRAFQWIFAAASDTTYTMTNLAYQKPVVGWRHTNDAGKYNSFVVLQGGTEVATEDPKYSDSNFFQGEVAPIRFEKSTVLPAAFLLKHYFRTSLGVAMACKQGDGDGSLTSGYLRASSNQSISVANAWRLKPIKEIPSSIGGATIVPAGEQNNVIYDLSGRRVSNAQNGLYIINGQKVLVK